MEMNGKEYHWHTFTGRVLGSDKNMKSVVSGSEGGGGGYIRNGTGHISNSSVNISSRTVVHDNIFLADEEGNEKAFQLSDFNIACRDGHTLTVAWAIKQGKDRGPYLMVYNSNHNTKTPYFDSDESPREYRRLICVSQATMADSSIRS